MADMFASSSAVISPCGRYRYRLDRRWSDGPAMGFIMLNPSTADADKDDPTIRRCIGFAKREGCGALIVVNLYALRATKPAELWATRPDQRHGPRSSIEYDGAIRQVDGPLIAAWGAEVVRNDPEMDEMARWYHGRRLLCLGKTKDGHPRHPLYVRSDAPLVPITDALMGGGE
jgi:hypothetical protein